MTTLIRLDGEDWQLRGCLGGSWRWYVGPERAWDEPGWLPARVPGSVTDDLWQAGEVPSPYFERNSLLLEWVPGRYWIYRRWLDVPALATGERATLVFEGVDYSATVVVDGKVLGEHEGMFAPFEVDATDAMASGGRHLVAVVVHPAPPSEPQVGDTAKVRVHKPRMNYGHDFCPRLVHVGIWQGVTLHLGRRPWRAQPVVAYDGDRLRGEGRVHVAGAKRLMLLDEDGSPLTVAHGPDLSLTTPELWWPNGLGPARCYRLRAENEDQSHDFRVGFRRLEMVANPGGPPGARPYTVVVNGRPIFLKGWNWAPVDALYGVPRPAKLAHLLGLAAASGANCLRAWGGGLLETPAFYDLCDRLGLLVWQEFSLSSSGQGSVPSEDPGYLAVMAAEAPVIIAERRHHPSLLLWCGGNELASSVPGRDDLPLDESSPVLGLLAGAVAENDPGRPWLPTSPSGPRFLNRLDIIEADPEGEHDVHGPWEHQGLAEHNVLYDAGTCLLHSEVGVEGMTNRPSLEALLAPKHRWPADRSNPFYEHLGAWWDNAPLVQCCFGGRLDDLDRLRRASQQLQYDGLRYAVESRLRKAPRTSGVFPWQLNESYPNAWCTASVDYYGAPKPAYYGVRRAYRPYHVCAAFSTWAWGGRPTVDAEVFAWPAPSWVEARVVGTDGEVVAEERFAPGVSPQGRLGVALDRVTTPIFFLDLASGSPGGVTVSRNRYLLSATEDLSPVLDLPEARVEARWHRGRLVLRHVAGPAAVGIVLEDGGPPEQTSGALFDDNMIDLLPREQRVVTVSWHRPPPPGRELRVEGWNVKCTTEVRI